MPVLSAESVALLRGINRDALTSSARIEAPTLAASAGGGANTGKRTWTTVAAGDAVPCRLTVANRPPAVTTEAGQPIAPDRVLVVFDLEGPAVLEGYRLTVTGVDVAGNAWTRRVLVLSGRAPRTYSAMRVFICQDVGPGGA